jgi:hypothetical protein
MDILWVKHARSCLRLGQHDAHAVAGLGELWVNRFVLATGQPLPVYPDERTSSNRPGCSGSCHFLTHAPQQEKLFDNLVCLREQRGWHGKPEKPTLIVRAHPRRRGCGKTTRRAKFRLTCRANQRYQLAPSFPGKRGGRASSRTREGMRWTRGASARNGVAGRVSRERSTGAQDERRSQRTAKPCGPDTRCWCQAVGGAIDPTGFDPHQAGSDGDKTNSSPGRARHKP